MYERVQWKVANELVISIDAVFSMCPKVFWKKIGFFRKLWEKKMRKIRIENSTRSL